MGYENILLERDGGVAWITINRPHVLNALNDATVLELGRALDELEPDDSVRVLVITGAGDKAFIAGADIKELQALTSAAEGQEKSLRGLRLLSKIEKFSRPVIMAINGYALGGGCELAMAGDIRLASDSAKLGQPEINLGIIPGWGGTQRLSRLVGKGAAKLLVFTGEMIDAAEALRLGLVDRVYPAAEFREKVAAFAGALAEKAPVALRLAKASINEGLETDLERGCYIEAANFGVVCATEDRVEGTGAFLEKRKPDFKGR